MDGHGKGCLRGCSAFRKVEAASQFCLDLRQQRCGTTQQLRSSEPPTPYSVLEAAAAAAVAAAAAAHLVHDLQQHHRRRQRTGRLEHLRARGSGMRGGASGRQEGRGAAMSAYFQISS